MFSRERLVMLVLVGWIGLIQVIWGQSRSGYGKPLATYKSSEGFTITSYSKNWGTSSKLKQISQELLSNEYGKEIGYLKNIYIYPDSPEGVLAYTHYDLKRDIRGNYTYRANAYIEIFDAEGYKNIQDMAWVLSHEYGHHFTIYHLINKENKFYDQWRNTGYARARNISTHPKIIYQTSYKNGSRMWDIMEIAAEDYVQLFGSPNAKRSIHYKDIKQKTQENISNNFNYLLGFNLQPQENLHIPLAADVKGLETYWRELANMPKTSSNPPAVKPKIRLVSKKELAKGHFQYRLEWDEIPGSKTYEYTLVAYPEATHIIPTPIKMVKTGEGMHAFVGSDLKTDPKTGKQTLVQDDYGGRYTFNLFIKDSDNKIYSSIPLDINFYYPVISNNSLYKDMHPLDWSYKPIQKLANLKIMVGSPDQYFYPLKQVTYVELMTVMDRCLVRDKKMPSGTFSKLIIENKQITQKELDTLSKKDKITREDVAYLIYQYMVLKEPPLHMKKGKTSFKDDKNIAKKDEINYLYKRGIVGGIDGYYFPNNQLTRQELASIISRVLEN